MSKRKRHAGGRPALPPEERRVRYAIRLPAELLDSFREATADKPRGEATQVVERAIRRYVRKHGKESHGE